MKTVVSALRFLVLVILLGRGGIKILVSVTVG